MHAMKVPERFPPSLKIRWIDMDAYLEPSRMSMMKFFCKANKLHRRCLTWF